ncbi:unnamed protein product [Prunus armeniaca]|uniref:Uncharacterized protein n=1 Tax=Prunus armeniaca TaxID=36596 RepID=A0A6J5TCP6_PRUAR|nr:unnamed protein product [Prunus armeniaca]
MPCAILDHAGKEAFGALQFRLVQTKKCFGALGSGGAVGALQFQLVQAKECFGALGSFGSCRQMSVFVPCAVLARASEGAFWCLVQLWLMQAEEHFGALCSFSSCRRRSVCTRVTQSPSS